MADATQSLVNRTEDGLNVGSRFLGPIHGLFEQFRNGVSVSYNEACSELLQLSRDGTVPINYDEFDIMVNHCFEYGLDRKMQEDTPANLTSDHISSIALYTLEFHAGKSLYHVLNGRLREADRNALKPFVKYIWLLVNALKYCPKFDGRLVYRGMRANVDASYGVGRTISWYSFSSCTCDIGVEQNEMFLGSSGVRTLFNIELTTNRGRVISDFSMVPSEKEILLPPNTRLKVSVLSAIHCIY
jgi:hypothetical protein